VGKMEAVCSETSVTFYQATLCHNSENGRVIFLRNVAEYLSQYSGVISQKATFDNRETSSDFIVSSLHPIPTTAATLIFLSMRLFCQDLIYFPFLSYSPIYGRFFSFLIFYAVGRTPWTGDEPVARPLPTHRTTQTQNKRTHRHPCLDWDSNSRSQRSSERRKFMP
jgi:hypothetical protein